MELNNSMPVNVTSDKSESGKRFSVALLLLSLLVKLFHLARKKLAALLGLLNHVSLPFVLFQKEKINFISGVEYE